MDNLNSKNILNGRPKYIENIENDIESFTGNINLFISWYNEKDENRKKEFINCLLKNISNRYINKIYLFVENNCECDFIEDKIEKIFIDKRITYLDAFTFINSITNKNDINILSNTDIYFDETIKFVFNKIDSNKVFCLTRWDILSNGKIEFHNRRDSQDAWIFYGSIKNNIQCNFNLGIPGCDNKIAYELEKSGYSIFNPSLSIKILHIHTSNIRNYSNNTPKLSRPYQFISPCTIDSIKSNRKKILHIGLNFEGQQTLTKALKMMGEYIYINWRKKVDEIGIINFNKFLIQAIRNIEPDFVFMQIQTPDIILPASIIKINEFNKVPILNWNGDIRKQTPLWMLELAKVSDNIHTAFTNGRDIKTFKMNGINNVHYIQIGFEENIYNADVKPMQNVPKIIFTGSYYGDHFPLSELRLEMFNKLKSSFGSNFMAYGGNWKKMGGNDSLTPKDTASLYKGAEIIISVNNINAFRYTSDRLLNILGTNSFCLANYVDGLNLDFQNNKHLVYWNNIDELIDLIKEYSKSENKNKRQEIAYNGMTEVWSNHRWLNRIEQMKTEILKW